MVNGQVINIPSCQVKPGDRIEIKERQRNQPRIVLSIEQAKARPSAEWIEVHYSDFYSIVKSVPARADLPVELNENAVVELYSK